MAIDLKVNPGVPAIPDIVITDPNLKQGYDALKEAVELLAGVRGDPNNRALTVGEATEDGETELFVTNIVTANAAASQDSVRLAGDVAGTGLFDNAGAVVVPTAIQLPNIIRVDGGASDTVYSSQPAGPYGIELGLPGGTTGQVLGKLSNTDFDIGWINQSGGGGGSALTLQDNGTSLTTAGTLINFVGFDVTEPVADQITVTLGPLVSAVEYCPNYSSYTRVDNDTFTIDLVNAEALFRVGRRVKFSESGNFDYGTISSVDYNITNANDTTVNLTMEGADTVPTGTFDVCLTTSGTAWSPIASDPFSGSAIRSIATGAISGTQWWVAVGDAGKLYTSTDGGVTWTSRTSGTTNVLNDVVYDAVEAAFYAGGEATSAAGSKLIKSTDGSTWSNVTIPWAGDEAGDYIHSMGYNRTGGYQMLSIWDQSLSFYQTYISNNGWSTSTARAGITAGGGFVGSDEHPAGADDWSYINGASVYNYTAFGDSTAALEETAPANITGYMAAYLNNGPVVTTFHFWGCANGDIGTHRTGIAQTLDDVTFTQSLNAFCHSELHSRTVVVGDGGAIGYLDDADAQTVDSWNSVANGMTPTANGLCVEFNETDGVFVCGCSNGQILRSSNGTN